MCVHAGVCEQAGGSGRDVCVGSPGAAHGWAVLGQGRHLLLRRCSLGTRHLRAPTARPAPRCQVRRLLSLASAFRLQHWDPGPYIPASPRTSVSKGQSPPSSPTHSLVMFRVCEGWYILCSEKGKRCTGPCATCHTFMTLITDTLHAIIMESVLDEFLLYTKHLNLGTCRAQGE